MARTPRTNPSGRLARNVMLLRFFAGVLLPLVALWFVFTHVVETRGEAAAAETAARTTQRVVDTALVSTLDPSDLVFPLGGERLSDVDAIFATLVGPGVDADELRIVNAGGVIVYSLDHDEIGETVELGREEERALNGTMSWAVADSANDGAILTYVLPVRLGTSTEPVGFVEMSGVDDVALGQIRGHRSGIRLLVFAGLAIVGLIQLWMLLHLVRNLWSQYDRSRQMAHYDPLTGLANRLYFHDRLAEAIASADRRDGNVGLVMIDLDGFKPVNDTGGHAAGDRLLKRVAAKLSEVTRREELAARIGGDEFAVVIPQLESPGQLAQMAERLREELDLSVDFTDGRAIRVTASLGLAVYPIDAVTPDDLVAAADVAMYGAKATRKGNPRTGGSGGEPGSSSLPDRIFR